ncbi:MULTISPECIES: zinc-binding dehydrogenase [unclassified Pseudomonas]|uniref:zinc-binding dehydrogenase n=1 Tax=unclassified Pseudomonas TaxID=196821 RepID=UPI000CD26CC4|nr:MULTISPECIES: zinc-binding dehydrogenase [unclassified Pseudomonas]POA59677.1 alcohol dehydrogenase [Pseudomonas sp. FW507-12TSA]
MKASVCRGIGSGFEVVDVDIDRPIGREVLIDVRACGLCHTDLTLSEADYGFTFPAVFGHEVSGVVRETGPLVTQVSVGDHVVGCLIAFCGRCVACLSGRTHECSEPGATLRAAEQDPRLSLAGTAITQGYGLGGFAEQALIHENQLAVINREIPFSHAAILGCATVTGAGAVINTARVRPGDTVAVFGTGGVGLNAINAARLSGALKIIAIDIIDAKLKRAVDFGATHVVNSLASDPVEAVRDITGGGVDFAFEAIGLPATQAQAIRAARDGGTALLIGLGKPGACITLDTSLSLLAEHKTIRGVAMGSTNLKRDIPLYADFCVDGRLLVGELVSEEISLEQIPSAYQRLKRGETLRAVVTQW